MRWSCYCIEEHGSSMATWIHRICVDWFLVCALNRDAKNPDLHPIRGRQLNEEHEHSGMLLRYIHNLGYFNESVLWLGLCSCIPHCSLMLAENPAESTANAKYCKNLPGKSTRNSVFLNQFGKLDDTCSTCSTFIHCQTRSLGNELEVAEWLRLRFLALLHLCKAGDDFRRMPQLDEPWKSWLFVCAWMDW